MDIDVALATRRTIHDFAQEPVDDQVLMRALEAALAAPNHRMTEPWRFIRVGPQARARLADLAVLAKAAKGPLAGDAADRARAKVLSPPELLVAVQMLADDPVTEREDYAAVACAIENLSLSLWASGVGSKWSTGAVTTLTETYAALGLDPEQAKIVGFVWVGRPASELPKAKRRKGLEDVLRSLP